MNYQIHQPYQIEITQTYTTSDLEQTSSIAFYDNTITTEFPEEDTPNNERSIREILTSIEDLLKKEKEPKFPTPSPFPLPTIDTITPWTPSKPLRPNHWDYIDSKPIPPIGSRPIHTNPWKPVDSKPLLPPIPYLWPYNDRPRKEGGQQ